MTQRALSCEVLLASLDRHGVPPHSGGCAVRLDAGTRDQIEGVFGPYVDRLLRLSGRTIGDPAAVTGPAVDADTVHSRFPDTASAALSSAPSHERDRRRARSGRGLEEARDFWQTQADDYVQARDYEKEQAHNWQKAAADFEAARDHWQEQARNWQNVAGGFREGAGLLA